MSNMADLTLLLIGKTGTGKSSTGNSLLGREEFPVDIPMSTISGIETATSTFRNGNHVTVIDGSGVGDTILTTETDVRRTLGNLKQAMKATSSGIDAFLLVLKYGSRFTEEDKSTIDSFKTILGNDFLSDYCVLVFTHGEIFDMNNQRRGRTFKSWCQQQTGGLRDLIEECGQRCILVYNMQREKMEPAVDLLIQHVNSLRGRRKPYNLQMLQRQDGQCQRMIDRMNAESRRQYFDDEIAKHQAKLGTIKKDQSGNHDWNIAALKNISEKARGLEMEIRSVDRGAGVLNSQLQACNTLVDSASGHIDTLNSAKEQLEMERQLEALKGGNYGTSAVNVDVDHKGKSTKQPGWSFWCVVVTLGFGLWWLVQKLGYGLWWLVCKLALHDYLPLGEQEEDEDKKEGRPSPC